MPPAATRTAVKTADALAFPGCYAYNANNDCHQCSDQCQERADTDCDGCHDNDRDADANTIDYEVTIDDPTVFTRPWTIRLPFRRADAAASDPYADEMWERACHEGNEAGKHMRELGFQWFSGVNPPN